jgi:uncharacterized protein YciI
MQLARAVFQHNTPACTTCDLVSLVYTDRDMRFAVTTKYTSDASTIAQARPAHREYLKGLADQGALVMSGPFADDTGGLFIYEARDAAQVENCIRQDPFARNGVFVSWEVRPWNVVFLNRALLCEEARRE